MRKTFLAITLFLAFSKAALAQFGNCTASEMRTYLMHKFVVSDKK